MKYLLGILAIAALTAATPIKPLNAMKMLSYMTGTWTCTTNYGGQNDTYKAQFSYAMGGTWMHQTDTWKSGGDEGYITYDAAKRIWRSVVMESSGETDVFEAPDTGLAHIAYKSVYPSTANMSETFDRVSFTKYTTHFVQKTGGKLIRSSDVCTKTSSSP